MPSTCSPPDGHGLPQFDRFGIAAKGEQLGSTGKAVPACGSIYRAV